MANEKQRDLIDRKTLSEELSTLSMMITGLRAGKGVLNEFMKEYRKSVLRVVDEAPTVDAVEVVRCRECFFGKGELICSNPKCTKSFYGCPVPPDHYCSFGEKRDVGGE